MGKKVLGLIASILVIIGALNWGLFGALKFDLVEAIFGTMSIASRVVYILVGLAGIFMLVKLFKKK